MSLLYRLRHHSWHYAKVYCLILCLTSVVYPAYNIFVDSKMYMDRYHYDQLHNKTYFAFLPGLRDAAVRRVPTQATADWSADMAWMVLYFSVGAWSGVMMMNPPTVASRHRRSSSAVAKKKLINVGSFYHGSAAEQGTGTPLLGKGVNVL